MDYINKDFFNFILIFLTIFLISQTKVSALDLSLESEIGYNDNIPKISEKKGSGFGLYQVSIFQPLNYKLLETNLFASGAYNDYFRVKDNYYLNAGVSFSLPILEGRFIPGMLSDLFIFRDNYLEKDSRNEVTAKIFIQWLVSSQLTLEIKQAWQWSKYKETSETQAEEQVSETGSKNYGKMWRNTGGELTEPAKNESRDDRIQTSGIQGIYYFNPDLQADLLLEHTTVNSSFDIESYKENKISASLIKTLYNMWELSLMGSVKLYNYESVSDRPDRRDTRWNTQITCSRFIKSLELRVQYQWEYNDSDENNESYHQQVTQCGLIWSF